MTTSPTTRYDIDAISTVEEYLDRSDWRVNANANQGYSLGGLILNSAGKMIANYWLERVYSPEALLFGERADRELPRNFAKRMGGSAGLLLL